MKAIILAAGLGTRMRPLTDQLPKPLLTVGGKPLIAHHLERLAAAGVETVGVNLSYQATRLADYLGDGKRWGVRLITSHEAEPLETGGGILQALARLRVGEDESVLVLNGDVWTTYPLARLVSRELEGALAHLVLVNNPTHHPEGDFSLSDGAVHSHGGVASERLTFSGLSLLSSALFRGCQPGVFPLAPLLKRAMAEQRVSGERWSGEWVDVGTPQRLAELDRRLGGRAYEDFLPESAEGSLPESGS